jgi:hypothetical protein
MCKGIVLKSESQFASLYVRGFATDDGLMTTARQLDVIKMEEFHE